MKYDAVIFDLDGTLLQSTSEDLSWLERAVERALEKQGLQTPDSRLMELSGIRGSEKFTEACRKVGAEPENLWPVVEGERMEGKKELIESGRLELKDGAEELLRFLHNQDIRASVISNSPDLTVEMVVEEFDLKSYLHYYRGITTFEDLAHRKPDPVHIDYALAELHCSNPVYVGDSESDEEASIREGIDDLILGKDIDGLSQVKALDRLE
ncbi:HAD hydrolase-like protein [Candidatus Nanohaloarchaea archaeon]|nr:HAD hydrolase-like protein [Candidatus Nanohaloarchaea archaeon]